MLSHSCKTVELLDVSLRIQNFGFTSVIFYISSVKCGCETWSATVTEEQKLLVTKIKKCCGEYVYIK